MQAAVQADRVPLSLRLDVPPRKPSERRKSSANKALHFEAFCQCMLAIETTRRIQAARLMSNLHLDSLPAVGMHVNGDDSDMLPLMDSEVRAITQDFASRAQRIVDNHGIEASEFNRLLQKTERDPFFRWRVHRQLKRANASVTLV
jgi:Domain of unknown function (DUF4168)